MSRLTEIKEIYDYILKEIMQDEQAWKDFLTFHARIYKHSFNNAVLIYAQRPEATLVADMEIWNRRIGRWINRGSKSIAVFDDQSAYLKLKYLFDIEDTHGQSHTIPKVWQLNEALESQLLENFKANTLSEWIARRTHESVLVYASDIQQGLEKELSKTKLSGLPLEGVTRQFIDSLIDNGKYFEPRYKNDNPPTRKAVYQPTLFDINYAENDIRQENYKKLMKIAPGILNGRYRYMKLKAPGFMDLVIEKLYENRISLSHYYEQNGDLMSDPDMELIVDHNQKTLTAATFQQDNMAIYHEAYQGDELINPDLEDELNDFFKDWLSNIARQGHIVYKAYYSEDIDEENKEPIFDDKGHEIIIEASLETDDLLDLEDEDLHEYPLEVGMEVDIEGRKFQIESIDYDSNAVSLMDLTFAGQTGYPIFRKESVDFVLDYLPDEKPLTEEEKWGIVSIGPVEDENQERQQSTKINYQFSPEDEIGIGGLKTKFRANVEAIKTLKVIETENRMATDKEQSILAKYVGWGGMPQAFDVGASGWSNEYGELKKLLLQEEYDSAKASTPNAHYTSSIVIQSIYKALDQFGFKKGNILEPSVGVGNFFSHLPDSMNKSKLFGVELDDVSGRIARQLYQKAEIQVKGYEETQFEDNFFDVAIGNVPFGNYKVYDRLYDKHNFMIHDYFFAKTLDKVRPGGIIAFVTSKGTMDKKDQAVRKYIAERAELIGAIRLPNTAFKENANTDVTADILFLKKRERRSVEIPRWLSASDNENGVPVNQYFIDHPHMMLGEMVFDERMFGRDSRYTTCVNTDNNFNLGEALSEAVSHLHAEIGYYEQVKKEDSNDIPANPKYKNYCYAFIDDKLYYRENSIMRRMDYTGKTLERIQGMMAIREITREIITLQTEGCTKDALEKAQDQLNQIYDAFVKDYGYITSRPNANAFRDDNDYPLLCSLEVEDEDHHVTKADMFTTSKAKLRIMANLQEHAFKSIAPYYTLDESIGEILKRVIPMSSFVGGFPFSSSGYNDGTGYYFGRDNTGGLVVLDPWKRGNDRTNTNFTIMGVAGVGKSTVVKHIALSEYMKGTKIIFIDPEREMRELCMALGGDWINAGGGTNGKINPLQIRPTPVDEDDQYYKDEGNGMGDMAIYMKNLEIFFSLYLPSISDKQKAILKNTLIELYNNFGIYWDTDINKLSNDDFPVFLDLHELLKEKIKDKLISPNEQNEYEELALLLQDIALGSDAFLWNGKSSIETNTRCVCLDTHDLQNTSDNIKRTQYFNILTWCWQQMSLDRTEPVLLICDESYLMIDPNVPQSLVFLRNVEKRGRKYEAGIAIISHSVVDFLDPKVKMYGQALLDIPAYKILMGCDGMNLIETKQLFNLTDAEEQLLAQKKRGNALVMIGSKRLHVNFQIPDYKFKFMGNSGGR